jgi:WD40 repeat protein
MITVWDIGDPAHPSPIGTPYPGSLVLGTFTFAARTFLAPSNDLLAIEDGAQTDVWDIRTHTPLYAPLPGAAIGESADGSTLATAAGDEVLLWDLATGQRRGPALQGFQPQGFGSVLFSPDGQRVAIPSTPADTGGSVTVLDLSSRHKVGQPIPGETLRYLVDGRIAIGVGETIEFWRPDVTVPVPFATPLSRGLGPGIEHWLSSTTVYRLPADLGLEYNGTPPTPPAPAFEWNVSTGHRVGDLLGAPQPQTPLVSASIVNHDGTLAALVNGGKIELWDTVRGRPAVVFDSGQHQPEVAWDPVAPILATAGLGGSLALWDISDPTHPKLLSTITIPGYVPFGIPSVMRTQFSPDGTTIAIQGSLSDATALVSVPGARVRHIFHTIEFTNGAVFTSDSKTVAIADIILTVDASVELRDVASGDLRGDIPVPYPELGSMAFVDGDRMLVTLQSAQLRGIDPEKVTSRVDLWDASTDLPVGEPIVVTGDAGAIEVDTPGGYRLVSSTTTKSGTDMVWDFNPASWEVLACRLAGRNLTQSEWKQYLPGRQYERTCPQWPTGP